MINETVNQSKKEGKDQESIQSAPHLAQNTTKESDKNTTKHHIQDSQEESPFPAGDHWAAINRRKNMTYMKHK